MPTRLLALLPLAALWVVPVPPARADEAVFRGELRVGVHTARMAAGQLYLIRAEGDGFAPALVLPAKGKSSSGSRGKDFHQLLHVAETSGDQRIVVGAWPGEAATARSLRYKLSIRPVSLGARVLWEKGSLDPADPAYGSSAEKVPHKAFKVALKAGRGYVIDLKDAGKTFDPYLLLEGPDGRVVARDDDGGEGLDARLLYTPARDGEYRIIATSLGKSAKGKFTLTVRPVE